MASAEKNNGSTSAELRDAKRYIKTSGNASISRAYFKETHSAIENTEIESKGLYVFEKLVRQAFTQSMQDDAVLGLHDSFLYYIEDVSDTLDQATINDWAPEASAKRMSDFMLSFFNLYGYQWKRHGRAADKTLILFLDIMHECLDFGYLKLNKKFDSLPKDIKGIINKTFFLTNSRIDEWYNEKLLEISAA